MGKIFGRKNVRGKGGARFKSGYDITREKAMQRNIVTEFILHEKLILTAGVLPQFKKNIDRLITYAKKKDAKEKNYRLVSKFLRVEKDEKGKKAITKLFEEIAPRFANRNGGYTRSYQYINRKGDGAKQVVVTFADPDQNPDNKKEAILK